MWFSPQKRALRICSLTKNYFLNYLALNKSDSDLQNQYYYLTIIEEVTLQRVMSPSAYIAYLKPTLKIT